MAQAAITHAVTASTPPLKEPAAQRLVSLDAFRGATVALMVLVNDPGNDRYIYRPLRHAEWNGWTPTDVVFPSFLWIVGVALTLSFARRIAAGASRAELLMQVFRRAAILYGFGVFIYLFPQFDLSTMRVLGVLQRIAICYLLASAIYLTTKVRGQLIWIVSLLAGYWLLMKLVPVPGYGPGHLDVARNFAHYVDWTVLGRHNYAGTHSWDPEGIVSTVPAIATTLFGILCGQILRLHRELAERTTLLFIIGNSLVAAGMLCDYWLPINKKLWTSSFCVFMAGLDFVIFAICLWLIEGRGYQKTMKPLVVLGMNAITVYVASELLDETLHTIRWTSEVGIVSLRDWIYQTLFAPLASPVNASLLYAIAYTLLMFGLAYGMYRRRWFLKI